MEACKEYVMNFSRDEINKLEKAVSYIEELANTFGDVMDTIEPEECPPNLRTLDYYFDQAQSTLSTLYDFVHEHCED